MRFLPVVLILCVFSTLSHAQGTQWDVDMDKSRLAFVFMQEGKSTEGEFKEFDAEIRFGADELATSKARVQVDLSSVSAGSMERNDALTSSDWFHISKFPKAVFESTAFRAMDDGRFETDATLTIKGIEQQLSMIFTLEGSGDYTVMKAEVPLKRLDFGLGHGFWANPEFIGLEVVVKIELWVQPSP